MNDKQLEILDADAPDMEHVGDPTAKVVEKAGQSMAARREQDNYPSISSADAMVSMIERIVMNPDIPIDRLQQVLDLKERMEDRAREDEERQARKVYFGAMSKCQKALPVVTKTKKNDHTKSTYADLAAIEEQAMPIIHDHGFAVSFQPDGYNDKGELRILWEISHEGGHHRSGVGEIPVDAAGSQGKVNKTGTQAFGSTATYGRRYLLCMLFNISTGDDRDGNNAFKDEEEPVFITEEQVMQLRDLLESKGANEAKFIKFIGVASLDKIYASAFQKAIDVVNTYKGAAA